MMLANLTRASSVIPSPNPFHPMPKLYHERNMNASREDLYV